MADFCELMRQWQRMCKSMQQKNMSCKEDCLLGHNPTCGELEYASLEEINNAETVIMKWAAEHPEPVYPTWGEWLESEGICFSCLTNYEHTNGFTIPKVFEYQIDGKTAFICGDRVNSPIPADIAQKLGIEPKEG